MIFAREPYPLHLLAGSESICALDAAKQLLDSGSCHVDEREPVDNLSALHVAAALDNLAFCHLLIHYGADVSCIDIDNRKPIDVAQGRCRKFFKKLKRKSPEDRLHLRKILAFFFGRKVQPSSFVPKSPFQNNKMRRSCPAMLKKASAPPLMCLSEVFNETTNVSMNQNLNMEIRESSTNQSISFGVNNSFKTMSSSICDKTAPFDSTPNNSEEAIASGEEPICAEELVLRAEFAKLNIGTLRQKLKELKCDVGPLDERTRRLYEGKLARLYIKPMQSGDDFIIKRYSAPLQRVLLDEKEGTDKTNDMGKIQEAWLQNEFLLSVNKNEVSFFCYLLIDPSKVSSTCSLLDFVAAIFYVGKGKHSRPLNHLVEARKYRAQIAGKNNHRGLANPEKLKRILELWDRGDGVISLHLSHNIHSTEALIREGAMIEAIGLNNLLNLRRTNFGSLECKWNSKQIEEFGAMLLRKAHVVFRNERCRPIFEADIAY